MSIELFELMEKRFVDLVLPAREYRQLLTSEKIKATLKKKKEVKEKNMTTGNKSYNRKSKKKSKVTSK